MRRSCCSGRPLNSPAILSLVIVAVLFVQGPEVSAQVVSPLQSGHYLPTITGVRDMSQPPPGFDVLWYNVFFATDTYIDRDGNEFTGLRLSEIDSDLPDVEVNLDLNGFATVPALVYVSHFELLGGARYLAGISPNYVTTDGTVVTEMGGGASDTTIKNVSEGSVSGFSDLFVSPLGLSWRIGKFDVTAIYGFYAPTGRYEKGGSNNVGLGFWTHQFQAYGYFYPFPHMGTAFMVGLIYEANGSIKDSDLHPGNRFTLEWGLSQYLTEQLELTVQGGHNWQVTEDSGGDVFWNPAVHDRKSTVAFGAGYWPVPGRLQITGKYAFDFGSRQRFDNSYAMINMIFLTNLLTGD